MTRAKTSRRRFTAAAIALAALPAFARTDAWPTRPLRVVVPFGTGTATRLLAQLLEARLKQPVMVENKPGANGAIAAAAVTKAPADGYTLLRGTNSTHGANPGLIEKMTYDPVKDFAPIGMVCLFSSFMVCTRRCRRGPSRSWSPMPRRTRRRWPSPAATRRA